MTFIYAIISGAWLLLGILIGMGIRFRRYRRVERGAENALYRYDRWERQHGHKATAPRELGWAMACDIRIGLKDGRKGR